MLEKSKIIDGERYLFRLSILSDKIQNSKFWLPLSLLSIIVGFAMLFCLILPLSNALIAGLFDTVFGFLPFFLLGALQGLGLYVIPFFVVTSLFFYIKLTDDYGKPNADFKPYYAIIMFALAIAAIAYLIDADLLSGIHTKIIHK
jgi:hypothetical protein